jgi:murein DD-endopeptidase MepM/ murein hydrolase activator NlpD
LHLPTATRRGIVYATVGVLLLGGFFYSVAPTRNAPALSQTADMTDLPEGVWVDSEMVDTLTQEKPPKAAAAASSSAAKIAEEPKPIVSTYVVVAGDSVGLIAERFGLKTSTVLWANDLGERDVISIGEELLIPAADGLVYQVRSGDNMWDISADHGADLDEIVAANPDLDPTALQPGQVLIIPGGKPARKAIASARGTGRSGAAWRFENWPTSGTITDHFGWRVHPVYGSQHLHDGLDLGLNSGTPLRAVSDGTVTMNSWFGGYGITIRVDHGGGVVTQYSHMSKVAVAVGERVSGGELIGYSGNTGVTTGPHLHFMVLVNGSAVDPMGWLP